MKVTMTLTGGWANIRTRCSVDTSELSQAQAARLEEAVQALVMLDFGVDPGPARDVRVYVVEVCAGGALRTTRFTDTNAPPSAWYLVDALRPYCHPLPWR